MNKFDNKWKNDDYSKNTSVMTFLIIQKIYAYYYTTHNLASHNIT